MEYVIGKNPCPRCVADGRDREGQNFHWYGEEEGGHCFSAFCGYTIPSLEYRTENEPQEYEHMGSKFNEEVHQKLKENTGVDSKGYRGIRTDVSRSLGVRYEYDVEDGSVVKTFYPTTMGCLEKEVADSIVGYKVRTHPKTFSSPIGETGRDCDMFMQWKFKTHKGMLLIVGGECYSEDTEVFTSDGWKLFKDLSMEDKVAQVEEGVATFVNPLRVIRKEYRGDMISYKSPHNIDILVTPNHKMVGVWEGEKDFYFSADEGCSKRHSFRKSVVMDGKGVDFSDDEIRFIVALSADAKIDYRSCGTGVAHFSFIKDRKIERLKGILDALNLKYNEYSKKEKKKDIRGKLYHTFNVTLPEWANKKGIPLEWVEKMSLRQKRLVIEEVAHWDGTFVKGRNAVEFYSKSFEEAEIINSLAITSGYHANIRHRSNNLGSWYTVKVSKGKSLGSFQRVSKTTEYYEGMVYCATVPSGQLLVRRNGKTIVCGNSDALAAYQMLLDMHNRGNGKDKYDEIAVVSGTTGEGGVANQLRKQYQWLTQFQKIIICMDEDKAGEKATEDIAKVLPKGKAFVMKMRYKDPNQYLMEGSAQDFINDFWNHRPHVPDGIKSSAEGFDNIEEELLAPRLTLPPYMHKMQKMMGGGIQQGRIANIIAATSVGKSTHVNRLAHHLIFNTDVSPTIVTLEATASQYSLDLLQTHVGKNFTFGKNGKEVMEFINTPEMLEYRKELAYREDGSPRYYMIDERSGSIKNIERQMEEMLKRYGSRVFIIDVLTDLLRGSATEYAEDHMNFQKILVKEGCTIINVMHTVKLPLGEDGKVRDATEFDAFGTGSFVQSAAINIVLNRDKVSENNVIRNTTRATLSKCRGGITGDAGEWYFDFKTHTCYDLEDYKAESPHMFVEGE